MGSRAAVAAVTALTLAAAARVAARNVEHLDVSVETPVYRLAPDLPVPVGSRDYRLSWSGFPVARVRIEMHPEASGALGVDFFGATHPAIDWLWRYRVEGRGRVNTDPFSPSSFVVAECENGDLLRTEIRFDEEGDGVRSLRQGRTSPWEYVFESSNTLDIPSSVYLVLNLEYAPGERFEIDTFTGQSRYLVGIEVEGREEVRLGDQSHEAWRLRLVTEELTHDDPEGRHRETFVWVTEARPRQLLRATSRTFVGRIQLELEPEGVQSDSLRGGRCA